MSNNIRITGLNSGLDVDSMIRVLNQSYQTKIDAVKKKQANVQYKVDAWNGINDKLYSFYSNVLSKDRFKSSFDTTKVTSSSSALTVNSTSDSINGNHTVEILSKAQTGYITGKKLSGVSKNSTMKDIGIETGTYKINGKDISIDGNMKISDIASKLKEVGINATFDDTQKRFFISSKESGVDADFNFDNTHTDSKLLNALGMSVENTVYLDSEGNYYRNKDMTEKIEDKTEISNIRNGQSAVRILGQDAEILLDGVSYKSSSNNMKVGGLDLTINDTSKDKITISTTKDYSGAIDSIKKLINDYNDIMKTMSTYYYTERGSYSPLTDSEKDSMSESQIKKWEDKLSSSALYRDSSLNSLMLTLRRSLTDGVVGTDGKTRYYSEFGLSSGNYLSTSKEDRYTINIDEKKLMKMLEEDEEGTISYFQGLSERMYKTIGNEMSKSPTLSSSYKVYNDKSMNEKISSYDKEIAKWEDKLNKAEDKYYKQFAKMESAFATLNYQTNFWSSLFNF